MWLYTCLAYFITVSVLSYSELQAIRWWQHNWLFAWACLFRPFDWHCLQLLEHYFYFYLKFLGLISRKIILALL